MNNWKPINTAPKDREILLAYKDGSISIGAYDETGYINSSMTGAFTDIRKEELLKTYFGTTHFKVWDKQPIAWQELPVFDKGDRWVNG
jgi:hypothetical protein